MTTSRPVTGLRVHLLPAVLLVAALASGCASGGSSSGNPRAHQSETGEAGSSTSHGEKADTPDERFAFWLNGRGRKGAYSLWSSGQLGAGPPPGATEKERRARFEEWLAANMDVLRAAWDRSQVLDTEGRLHEAMAVTLTYRVDHGGFAGLSVGWAEDLDSALEFNTSETVFGEVSIRNPTQGTVILTTDSGSGQVLCMAWDTTRSKPDSYGTSDAHTVAECDGGGWLK